MRPSGTRRMVAAAVLSLAAYAALHSSGILQIPAPHAAAMVRAARTMDRAITAVGQERRVSGVNFDSSIDPNRTGLIGPEVDELTTSLGHLEAKRTATNPNFAALVVHLLCKAGVQAGDTVAIGASGSFPALLIASLAAAEAMNARPAVILSLGASSYGATDTRLDLLSLYRRLLSAGLFASPPVAVSLGGEQDKGLGFEPETQRALVREIGESGLPFVHESGLRANVAQRMAHYDRASSPRPVAAFINIGGAYANMGTSPKALELKPGLNLEVSLPPEAERGVIFEMAARGVPVIHLLFVKGLAGRHGLPWDPVPLPPPGDWLPSDPDGGTAFWLVAIAYLGLLLWLLPRTES